MTNMYLFLYSAQTLLQYYVTKMDEHVCIFLEKKYYAWLVSFGGKNQSLCNQSCRLEYLFHN